MDLSCSPLTIQLNDDVPPESLQGLVPPQSSLTVDSASKSLLISQVPIWIKTSCVHVVLPDFAVFIAA